VSDSKINVSSGFNGGLSVSLRADSPEELAALAKSIYGEAAGTEFVQSVFASLLSDKPMASAINNLNRAVGPVQTVPQPQPQAAQLQQPYVQPQAAPPVQFAGQQAQPAGPPGSEQPVCAHGPKKWVPPGFSQKTQKSYQGFWACNAPQGQPKCK
jgi:hypothetical protein